jgi:bacteriorhodopsin
MVPGLRSVTRLGRGYRTPYLVPAATLAFLWMVYPVAWGLAEGGNVISVNSDIIFYGIIDLVLVTLVVMAFLGLVSKVDHQEYASHRVRPPSRGFQGGLPAH